jgi:hypothetical protein
MQEETHEIAMAGMVSKASAATRHMPAAHDRRTASMPSWCLRLLSMRHYMDVAAHQGAQLVNHWYQSVNINPI